jgi:nucleoside-diphosphate-sugar epimerase
MAFARIVQALAHDEEFEVYGDGSQSRSFTYVADVVDATVSALEAPEGIYNVGGGDEATLREALELLEEISGRPLRVSYGPTQAGDMQRTKADTSRLESAVAWRPTTPLRDGLADHWRWASAKVTTR